MKNTLANDLFDRLDFWFESPEQAFAGWISAQDLAHGTQVVRISMWNKFIRWFQTQGGDLKNCRAEHITRFLHGAELDKEQAWRYVVLIEQVFDRLNVLGLDNTNPGRQAGQAGIGNRSNAPTRFLNPWERDEVLSVINQILDERESDSGFNAYLALPQRDQHKAWALLRDATIAAIMLGGGVKVSELASLTQDAAYLQGDLQIVGQYGPHCAPLFPIAVTALDIWQPYRQHENGLGDTLFPAMVNKRRHDQSAMAASLHPANVFRRLKALLNQAGIQGSRACGQTLRNTYAAQLIESGASDELITQALGFKPGGEFTVPRLRYEYARACGLADMGADESLDIS